MGRKKDLLQKKRILQLVEEGLCPATISRLMGKSLSVIARHIKDYENAGLIRKTCPRPALYVLTNRGKEQLSALSDVSTDVSPHGMNNSSPRIHSSHKIKLSIPYMGTQPEGGIVRYFGRYRKQKQVIFRVSDRITVVAFTKKLNVWVHHPKGNLTEEQMINAKTEAYQSAVIFSKSHGIKVLASPDKVIQSHHVVEFEPINRALKPIFKEHGEAIEARVGSHLCKTSHKGKIEHEGKRREDKTVHGESMAKGFEYVFLELKKDMEVIKREVADIKKEDVSLLREMIDTVKIRKEFEEQRKNERSTFN